GTESRAICRYICSKYPTKGNKALYGTNPLSQASIEQWLEAESQSFNPPSGTLVFQLAFAPRMKIPQDQKAIRLNEDKLGKVLDVYENRLGESRYLAGDEFSLADLSHLPNADYLTTVAGKEEMFSSRKNVGRWLDESMERESWKKVKELRK
ncbi:Glutathione S-transferase F10, partial [Linum perenne]